MPVRTNIQQYGKIIEIKDVKKLNNTRQIRTEATVAAQQGKPLSIITGEKTNISRNILRNDMIEIVRRSDLGPQ